MKYIIKIFNENLWKILLVYSYCFIGEGLWLIEPFVLGKMIDGLMVRDFTYLFYFILLNFVFIIIGFTRRIVDTKIFTKIYNKTVLSFIKKNNCDTSTTVARSYMAREIVSFLENQIPYYFTVLFSVFGSIVFLFTINKILGFIILLFTIPIILTTKYFYKKTNKVTILQNTMQEQEVSKIESKNMEIITDFFVRKRKVTIMNSNINAKNWSSFDFFKLSFTLIALTYYITSSNVSTGEAVTVLSYITRFTGALVSIPFTVETYSRLKDITKRLTI